MATKSTCLRLLIVNIKNMKTLFCFIPLLFIFGLVKSQVYNMNEVSGLTINTCFGEFNDSGGHAHNC